MISMQELKEVRLTVFGIWWWLAICSIIIYDNHLQMLILAKENILFSPDLYISFAIAMQRIMGFGWETRTKANESVFYFYADVWYANDHGLSGARLCPTSAYESAAEHQREFLFNISHSIQCPHVVCHKWYTIRFFSPILEVFKYIWEDPVEICEQMYGQIWKT